MFVGNDILNYLHGGAKNTLFALKFGNGSTNNLTNVSCSVR